MEMNRKQVLWLGISAGLAAVAGTAALRYPTKARRRRMAIRAIGKAADDLSGMLKIF